MLTPARVNVKEDDTSLAAIGLYTSTAGVLAKQGDVYNGASVGERQSQYKHCQSRFCSAIWASC